MVLSPKLGIHLLGDNDNVDPAIVTLNSGILDTAAPCVLFSPPSSSTPQPNGRFDGDWRYNSLSQTLSRWNATTNKWQAIAQADGWRDPYTMRPRLVATNTNTAASLITGGGGGLAQVDLNLWSYTIPASGSLVGDYPVVGIVYVERGWFWWTGTPYPPTSKIYKAQIYTNIGYKAAPPGSAPSTSSINEVGPASLAPSTIACIANATYGYNSDKMGCKVSYQLVGQFQVVAQDAASTVTMYSRSIFQTDSSQFPNTMSAGRSADANGSSKAYIYQAY